MRGIGELRVKESDRIALMAAGLEACGVEVEEEPDGLIVSARPGPSRPRGGGAGGDPRRPPHRHEPPGAGPGRRGAGRVDEPGMIATSFPGFARPDARAGRGDRGGVSVSFVIAVDGPAASGKGDHRHAARPRPTACRCWTPACSTAPSAWPCWRAGGDLDDAAAAAAAAARRSTSPPGRPGLARAARPGEAASRVAVHPAVRAALLRLPARLRRASRAARCSTGATSAR